MSAIHAYLFFTGKCREAFEFYQECIGGELFLQTLGESPVADQFADKADWIMHAALTKNGLTIMGSDMMTDEQAVPTNAISLSLSCDSEAELQEVFAKLSDGGKVNSPLKTEFWGDIFGQLTDKYGFNWMVGFTPEKKS